MSEKIFSARLTEAIKASGLSQSALAEKAGITAAYLSDLKNGKKGNPSPEVLRKLAAALAITPAWLISFTDAGGFSRHQLDSPETAKPSRYPKDSDVSESTHPASVDPRMLAKLAEARRLITEWNEPTEEEILSTLESVSVCLRQVAINDGEFAKRMLDAAKVKLDDFAARAHNLRASKQ